MKVLKPGSAREYPSWGARAALLLLVLAGSLSHAPETGAQEPDLALQTPDGDVPKEVSPGKPPIAGPVPKLEPLATQANRPYRLRGRTYRPMTNLRPFRQRGTASWYGKPFQGRRTANGERYEMKGMSAAHPTLPLPSYVKVTNLTNGTSVVVRVNDRGPFAQDRVIDVSYAAARHLGILQEGTAAVELDLIVPKAGGVPAHVTGVAE